ncbi:MAG TPA: endolytic transglycosylase MltG [Sphingomicrobium sp.]
MRRLWRRLALGILIAVGVPLLVLGWGWYGPGPLPRPSAVIVKEGWTVATAARELEKAGVVSSARRFRIGARLLGGSAPIRAGEFAIPARASPAKVLNILQFAEPVQRLITVTEGMPSVIVEEKLAAIPYLTGSTPRIAEGAVLPDTYGYERGEARSAVVQRMRAAMTKTLDQLWPKRSYSCPIATRDQAVILASIVEKETGKAAERPMIAGVYCNRLKIGMKLDADPTVIYPITRGKPLGRRILRSELLARNGYNTYRMPGLPEGPIANPGKASIAAVLNPAPTRAIYFVADGTGGHVFADSFAQHQTNVAKWYAIRRQRGQM